MRLRTRAFFMNAVGALHACILEAIESLYGIGIVPSILNASRITPCAARSGTKPFHIAIRPARRRRESPPIAKPSRGLPRH